MKFLGTVFRFALYVGAVSCLSLAFFIVLDQISEQAPVEYRPDYPLFADCLWERDFQHIFVMSANEIEHGLEFCYRVSIASQK